MRIYKQGHKIILFNFVVSAIIVIVLSLFLNSIFILSGILIILLSFLLLIIWFFRIPYRKPVIDENLIYSPADGKIVVIEETMETEYFNEKRTQVSIFMSPLNVHANYYPVSGTIEYYKYHSGKYLVAWHPKSSTENERATVVIMTEKKEKILVKQVAGAVARRIITNDREGKQVMQGEELGFIRFGSRVDIFLPSNIKILTSLNQKVKGKITVIARFNEK